MKKRLFTLAMALMMALILLPVSAFAATDTPPYTVSGYGPNGEPFTVVTKDVTLRNITETPSFSGPIKNWYTTFTRDSETKTFPGDKLYVLPTGGKIVVDGMRTGNDPTDWVSISAWSDPDGDGIFDQQIFKTSGDASPVPTLDKGPFEFRYDGSTKYGYELYRFVLKSNSLDGELDEAQATVEISTEFLTKLFGPNTIVQLELMTRGDTEDGGYGTYGQQYYSYYIPAAESTPAPTFTDVPAGEWYADPVAWAVEKNITNGTEPTKFSPGQDCTQAQILTFLYRAARGEGAATAEDMDKAISWARDKGMIDNSFNGSTPCTRSTAVSYIWQAFNKPNAKASSFTDVDANAAYAKAVNWAVEKGITKGDGSESTFAPDKVCTRGHIVTFLYRAYNN